MTRAFIILALLAVGCAEPAPHAAVVPPPAPVSASETGLQAAPLPPCGEVAANHAAAPVGGCYTPDAARLCRKCSDTESTNIRCVPSAEIPPACPAAD